MPKVKNIKSRLHDEASKSKENLGVDLDAQTCSEFIAGRILLQEGFYNSVQTLFFLPVCGLDEASAGCREEQAG